MRKPKNGEPAEFNLHCVIYKRKGRTKRHYALTSEEAYRWAGTKKLGPRSFDVLQVTIRATAAAIAETMNMILAD